MTLPPGQPPVGGPPPFGHRPPSAAPAYAVPQYPPMMMPTWPAPPRTGGFARAIFTTLATTIFGLSIALNIYLLAFNGLKSASTSGGIAITTVIDAGSDKVVILPIDGVILDSTAELFDAFCRRLSTDSSVRAVVIDMNTPGGGVTASDVIYRRVNDLRAKGVKVVVAMRTLGTSGGYYIACAADEVMAQPTTWTGNIGVILQSYNAAEGLAKIGIVDNSLHSSGSPFKGAGSPTAPERPEDRAYLQTMIDEAYVGFRQVVAAGRAGRLKAPIAEVADGRAFTASQALANGLIDRTGYLDDAITRAAALASITSPTVERYDRQPSLGEQLFGGRSQSESAAMLLDRLSTPRAMYLWQGR